MSNWTNKTKNTSTATNLQRSDTLGYITTDTPDYILVGENEDERLIWNGPSIWSNLIKQ